MTKEIEKRLGALERTAVVGDERQAQIETDAEWVRAKIAEMAARMTDAERAQMADWWAQCSSLAYTDPRLAKAFAGFSLADTQL